MSAHSFPFFRLLLRACFLACSPLLFSACNNVAHLPENQSLLVKNKVKVSRGGEVSKMDMTNMLIQEPNSKILGARIRLGIYNGAKPDKHNWWNNKLRELGEPPVVFDSSTIVSSQERILMHAASKGYFYPELTSEVKRKGKLNRKVVVSYNLKLDEPYRLRQIDLSVLDDSLRDEFETWARNTLLKPGMQYMVSSLDAERTRIAERLQNIGYWAFSKDYISYSIDSALSSKQMDVQLLVKKMNSNLTDSLTGDPILFSHKKYYIDNVYIFPQSRSRERDLAFDTMLFENATRREKRKGLASPVYYFINQGKPIIKYKPLLQKTFLRGGDRYSLLNVTQTYNNLGDLRVFQYNSISFTERPYDTALSYFENNKLEGGAVNEIYP